MKVLVAVDGSDESRHALRWATNLAKADAAGRVTVLSIAPALEAAPPIADAIDPSSDVSVHRKELQEAAGLLAEAGVKGDTVLKSGNPAEEILDLAEGDAYDLIVLGHRGMSGARRFLMGSVSERVVRHATVPVLVVR
ncbi:MAG: universal stress protein [Candidatus Dormibacteraeota bacterium]|nr:universal stress protein [Candidatus Dormibacteraeota bacterium]